MTMLFFSVLSLPVCVNLLLTLALRPVLALKNNAYLLQDHRSYSLAISVTNQNGFKSSGNDSQIFSVQAPKYHRVMIVIQQLYLWPEIDKDFQSYLQFVDSDGTVGNKIFGNVDPDETNLTPQYLTGPRSFVSKEDTASLVFINLRPDHVISSKNERRVYAKVVFTAFRDTCSYRSIPPPTENVTIIRRQEMLYRSCTTSSATGKNCIAAELFCDGNFNCGETEMETFGIDETYMNCDKERKLRTSRAFSTFNGSLNDSNKNHHGSIHPNSVDSQNKPGVGGDLSKTLIVDQEYDEYFTELFKSVIVGFLGLCTTCILIAFIVTMFCFNGRNRHDGEF